MSAGAVADPTAGMCAYLQGQVGTLVENRLFRPRLPKREAQSMPRACIVVRHRGGYTLTGRGTIRVGDPHLVIACYGSTDLEAQDVAQAVVVALRELERQVCAGVLLHWASITAGPIPLVDPEAHWPFFIVSAQVAFAELTVS